MYPSLCVTSIRGIRPVVGGGREGDGAGALYARDRGLPGSGGISECCPSVRSVVPVAFKNERQLPFISALRDPCLGPSDVKTCGCHPSR